MDSNRVQMQLAKLFYMRGEQLIGLVNSVLSVQLGKKLQERNSQV
jgi:hypothetical protein